MKKITKNLLAGIGTVSIGFMVYTLWERNNWNYICLLINLFNREIVGYSVGTKKDASLVYEAFMNTKINLSKVKIFHTDRGNEFKNKIIDEVLEAFKIKRSLSKKGCPYDNAVAEAGYKIIKIEFAFNKTFKDIETLRKELSDYVLCIMYYGITINEYIEH